MTEQQKFSAQVIVWCGIGILLCLLLSLIMARQANPPNDRQAAASLPLHSIHTQAAPAIIEVKK